MEFVVRTANILLTLCDENCKLENLIFFSAEIPSDWSHCFSNAIFKRFKLMRKLRMIYLCEWIFRWPIRRCWASGESMRCQNIFQFFVNSFLRRCVYSSSGSSLHNYRLVNIRRDSNRKFFWFKFFFFFFNKNFLIQNHFNFPHENVLFKSMAFCLDYRESSLFCLRYHSSHIAQIYIFCFEFFCHKITSIRWFVDSCWAW